MLISVRVEERLAAELERAAADGGVSKSEFVRQCLTDYLARRKVGNLAWELGKNLFGKHRSGRGDLSANADQIVREKIHARGRRR